MPSLNLMLDALRCASALSIAFIPFLSAAAFSNPLPQKLNYPVVSNPKSGYTRSDGTSVSGYFRSR